MIRGDNKEAETTATGPVDIEAGQNDAEEEEAISPVEGDNEHQDRNPSLGPLPLDPPRSCGEKFRDIILRILDHRIFQLMGIITLILIVVDGAFFFFLLLGWHGLCSEDDDPSTSRNDCPMRNELYIASVQLLNALFTYQAFETVTWRLANFIHASGCSNHRDNSDGHDLYGRPTKDMWFHVPRKRRIGISVVLLLNCGSQFLNQCSRFYFVSFEEQASYPGMLWTNLFFCLAALFGAVGAFWYVYEEQMLIRAHPPGTFPPGLIQVVQSNLKRYICKNDKEILTPTTVTSPGYAGGDVDETHQRPGADSQDNPKDCANENSAKNEQVEDGDPTENRFHRRLINCSRPGMRLFGL